jgi:2-oxoglutarate dehydrogenase E2 component (dihydrolipoamide succinyltransferase)
MATVPITVPGVGESITEGILSRWIVPDGSAVDVGTPLFELETDKASTEVPSPGAGVLKISVKEGETVAIGASVGMIDSSASPTAAAPTTDSKPSPSANPKPASVPPPDANGGSLSPAVRRITAEEGIDPSSIEGTGRGGRVTKGDVLARLESGPVAATAPPPRPSQPTSPAPLQTPTSTGPRETRKRMTGIRQKIAQRLVEAQQTAAILTTFNEADMSRVMELRARYKESFTKKHGVGLGFSSFFIKAAIEALKAFPAVNGRVDGQDIVYNNVYDIGVAVSTERGLMVPVIRDADKLSFSGVEKAIVDYAKKARENAISVNDLQGGTFTITNGGVFGSLLSTPILNPPQSGILGMHSIQKRPVVVDDQIVIRPMMYLALSYDHRIVDGREAVSFLVRVKECIENPERLMLDV